MYTNLPIYSLSKELNIDSKRIILACKNLGISAKGSTKKLNKSELEKVKKYFETGKNAAEEIIEVTHNKLKPNRKTKKNMEEVKVSYFPNRLTRKS